MNTSNALLVVYQVTTIVILNAAVIISIVSLLVHKEWVISNRDPAFYKQVLIMTPTRSNY